METIIFPIELQIQFLPYILNTRLKVIPSPHKYNPWDTLDLSRLICSASQQFPLTASIPR